MKELVFVLAFALGAPVQYCFPPSCTIDSNCLDTIHGVAGKCCGGVCLTTGGFIGVGDRLIGESCDLKFHETCFGACGSGSFCGSDGKCRGSPGLGCQCTSATPCADGTACSSADSTPGTCIVPTAIGTPCIGSETCESNYCNNATRQCAYLNTGEPCLRARECGPGNMCKYFNSTVLYRCTPLCATGVAGCCSYHSDCLNGLCNGTTCIPLLGLGEPCSLYGQCMSPYSCEMLCNSTDCYPNQTSCQTPLKMAVGQPCRYLSHCAQNATCQNNTCTAFGSVALGQPCSLDQVCMAPAICAPQGSSFVCQVNARDRKSVV